MKKIVFYGEHPFGFTGNGNMLCAMLMGVDTSKYTATCLVTGKSEPALYDVFKVMPFNLVSVVSPDDMWGLDSLMRTVTNKEFDVFVTVGVDIWRFSPILQPLREKL